MQCRTVLAAICLFVLPATGHAASSNRNLEIAAIMNVAENICNINWGQKAGRGVVHHVLLAAAEMRISMEKAVELADKRSQEVMYQVITKRRQAQFCRNAKAGKF